MPIPLKDLQPLIDRLMDERKLLEAMWTADMKSRAPDGIGEGSFELSLHSFLIGAFHVLLLHQQMIREHWPADHFAATIECLRREILTATGHDLNQPPSMTVERGSWLH